MAKAEEKKKKTLEETLAALDKKFAQPDIDTFFVSTDSIYLDWALGGQGVASKRVAELIAWEGSGKTSLCLHLVKNFQRMAKDPTSIVFGKKALFVDAEKALDEKYARAIGVDWDDLINITPDSGEEGFTYMEDLISSGGIGIAVCDSVSGMLPLSQIEGAPGHSNMGKHALLMGAEVPKVANFTHKYNTVTVFISQLREKIGVMFGSPETTPGGNALKFFASTRIRLGSTKEKEDGDVIGLKPSFQTLKCKTAPPFRKGFLYIKFGKGIDRLKEVLTLGKKYKVIFERQGQIGFGDERILVEDFPKHVEDYSSVFMEIRKQIMQKLDDDSEGIETTEGEE